MDSQFSTYEASTVNSATSHHKAHVRDGGRTVEVRSQSLWQMGAGQFKKATDCPVETGGIAMDSSMYKETRHRRCIFSNFAVG